MGGLWVVLQAILLGAFFARGEGEERESGLTLIVRGAVVVGGGIVFATVVCAAALFPEWREGVLARYEPGGDWEMLHDMLADEPRTAEELEAARADAYAYADAQASFPKYFAKMVLPFGLYGFGFALPAIFLAALPFAREIRD